MKGLSRQTPDFAGSSSAGTTTRICVSGNKKPMRAKTAPVAGLLTVVLAAGCGSTIQGGSGAAGGQSVSGLSTTGGLDAGGPGSATGLGGGAGTGGSRSSGTTGAAGAGSAGVTIGGGSTSSGAGSTGSARAGSQNGSSSSSGGSGSGATYPGVTASSIYVGLTVAGSSSSTGSQIASNYGFSGFSSPPDHAVQDALIKFINKHGGVRGRKLVPVYRTYDPNDTKPYAVQSQDSCTYFTQDKHVFAHLNVVSDPTFFTCMEHAGTVGIENTDIGQRQAVTPYRGIFYPSQLDQFDVGALLGHALTANGFLGKSNRIGLLQEDSSVFDQARSQGLEPALRAAGLSGIKDIYRVPQITESGGVANAISAVNSAVLKFHTDGVDRVLFLTQYGALLDSIFMKDANGQHYYPKYGLSTSDGAVALTGGNAPPAELAGSVGVGWQPLIDINDPAKRTLSPSIKVCLRALRESHVPPPKDDGQYFGDLGFCDAFFHFVAIASRAGPDLTRNNFIAAGESLGSGFRAQLTNRGTTQFHGAAVHDGASAWSTFAYGTSCDCYRAASERGLLRR